MIVREDVCGDYHPYTLTEGDKDFLKTCLKASRNNASSIINIRDESDAKTFGLIADKLAALAVKYEFGEKCIAFKRFFIIEYREGETIGGSVVINSYGIKIIEPILYAILKIEEDK